MKIVTWKKIGTILNKPERAGTLAPLVGKNDFLRWRLNVNPNARDLLFYRRYSIIVATVKLKNTNLNNMAYVGIHSSLGHLRF